MPRIIISYRRSDSQAIAGRIFDRLNMRYGEEAVFMDIDAIPFGTDFRRHIGQALQQCDALIALVGPHWLGRRDDGSNRIADPADPVRVELEGAMERGIPVIPVLIDGARMPAEAELPQSLKQFSYFNAAPVDSGRDFRAHMDRLIKAVDGLIGPVGVAAAPAAPVPAAPARHRSRNILVAVAGTLLVGGVAALLVTASWWSKPESGVKTDVSPQSPPLALTTLKTSEQSLVKMFGDKFRESKLNLDIQLDSDAAQALVSDHWDAIAKGKLDLAAFYLHVVRDKVPEFEAMFMPGLVRSPERGRRLNNSAFMGQIKRKAVERGVIILGGNWISVAVTSKKGCIRRPEDAKGRNIFPGSANFGLMWQSAGAALVEQPDFSGANAFRLNADAIETTLVEALQVADLAKCTILAGEHGLGFMYNAMLASKATFDRLNRNQQNELLKVAAEAETELSDGYKKLDDYLVRMLGTAGVETVSLSEAEYEAWLQVARASSHKEFAVKVPDGRQLIESALAVK
jgi:TRAP-type C4-dicarboxylate transport system substrate-binding protein